MNLIDMDRLRKELMAKGDIPIHEVFNTIWDQPIVNICEVEDQQPSEDWKFYYNHGYAQAKRDLLCEDCISREDAKNLFWDGTEGYDCRGFTRMEIGEMLGDLPSVTPQQTRWIPCSERLPERDENVLTYHRNESFDYQYISWIDDYSGKWAGFIGNLSDEVLAWRPLPEGYKEDKG